MHLSIIEHGTVCAGRDGGMSSLCFPDVLALADGSLLAGFRAGSAKDTADGRVYLTRSRDGGRTWTAPVAPFDPEWQGRPGEQRVGYLTELAPGHLLVSLTWVDRSDPALPFFNPETEGLLPTIALLAESGDDGRTWSPLRPLDTSPYHTPTPLTGPVLRLPDGTLVAQFELNKEYGDAGPWSHAAVLKLSADGGRTWPRHVDAARHPKNAVYYWDQRPALMPDGRLISAFWTYDAVAQRDLNVHVAFGTDGATRWSAPRDTGLAGQCPFPVPLGGDRVVLIWVDRYRDACLRAALSADGGETWDAAEPVTVYSRRDDPGAPAARTGSTGEYLQEMELWDFGLPRGVLGPDGSIFVIYYAAEGSGRTRIAWKRLEVGA
jgi:sialidase-1